LPRSYLAPLRAVLLLLALLGGAPAPLLAGQASVLLTAEERAWLDANQGGITLVYDVAFPPIEFQDEEGRYAGIGADIVAKIEALLGVSFVKVPTNDWNGFLKDLESGKAFLNAGMASTPERELFASCTAPYIKLPLAILATTKNFAGQPVDWKGLSGRRVAVVSGYMTESYVRRNSAGRFTVVPVGSVQEGLRAVSFGVVDAFVENLASASYYLDRDALTNLRVAGSVEAVFPMSICVSRKYPLLLSAVQKALGAIAPEDFEGMRKHWIHHGGRGLLSQENQRLLRLAGIFVALLFVGLAGISCILKRRLNEKVRSLGDAQQELQKQTERLELALDATSAAVWEYYPLTGVHLCSPQWFAMLGREPGGGESTLDTWKELLHPDDISGAAQALADYCASNGRGLYEAEFRMRRADGAWCWVLGKGRAVAWDVHGRPERIVGLNTDIQKLKNVQEELRRSEALVKAAFDQTYQLCALLDAQGRVVSVNKSALAFCGKPQQEIVGQPFWECPFWPDAFAAEAMLRQAMVTVLAGEVFHREVVNLNAHGIHALLDFTLSPLIESDGSVKILIAEGRDISEIRRAEAALKASEEKYRAIFNNAPIGIFRSTFGGSPLEVNTALARMHGHESAAELLVGVRHLGFEGYGSATDREVLLRKLSQSPRGVSMEVSLRRRNGETFPAIINASLQHDAAGNPCYIDGAVEDITERKRSEAALHEKTALLEAQVNATLDGILVVNDARKRLLINRRMLELFNLSPQMLDTEDDSELLKHVVGLTADPACFLAKVEELYGNPLAVSRDEIAFKSGMLLDRYSAPVLGKDGKCYGRIWTFRDITDRKQLELRLANQLAFQEALLNTLPYAIFYKGPDSRFLGFNKAYEECFGVQREELIGKRVLDLEFLPLDDRLAYQAEDEDIIGKVGRAQREGPITFADGAVHQMLYSVTGFRQLDGSPGGLIGVIVDISERKQDEERLRQSEEKFSRIFEMAPECIFFVRLKDLAVIDTNAAFESITGHLRDEAIGRSLDEVGFWNEPADRAEFLQMLQNEGRILNYEFLLRRKDGVLRRVVNSSQLVRIAGEACFISIIHDITDERRMQELLIQSEKMMSVGSLAAGIAHEINNPLGIVHQAVQNVIQRTSPGQKKNLETAASIGLDMDLLQQYLRLRKLDVFLEDIQAAALRASGIIRNMLNFSRRSESTRGVCDLHRIIEQSVFLASSDYDLKKAYDFKRIEIVLDLATEHPRCACTETELEQVLLNLLRNAAQAMAMAHPPTPNPKIQIRLRALEAGVCIEVADNGPGMDVEVQRKVFEPFFTTKPPGVGTGLGLSVSYFIITKGHGGRMWLTSTPGTGTTFFIELPAEPQEATNV